MTLSEKQPLCILLIAFGAGGCATVVTMTAVAIWFQKNVSLALGIAACGFGAGGLIPPLIVFLTDAFGWRSTLIILGDGRTNFLDPRPDLLEALRVRCRRIVWLNPEAEELWEDGDSRISAYRPHCDEVRPCRNLNELSDFISGLIL